MSTSIRMRPALLAGATALLLSAGAALAVAQDQDEPIQKQTRAQDESVPAPVDRQDEPPSRTSAETSTMREPESVPPTSATALPPERPTAATTGITPAVQAQFDALDTDHDGTIDRNEAASSRVLSAQFSALDSKGSGRLTIEQFAAASDIALIRNEGDALQR
jgi:hypothetical protein